MQVFANPSRLGLGIGLGTAGLGWAWVVQLVPEVEEFFTRLFTDKKFKSELRKIAQELQFEIS